MWWFAGTGLRDTSLPVPGEFILPASTCLGLNPNATVASGRRAQDPINAEMELELCDMTAH